MEEPEGDNLSDTAHLISHLPDYSIDEQCPPLERRSTLSCLLWSTAVATINIFVFIVNFTLLVVVFGLVLLPTIVIIYFGFKCHSRVLHSNASYCQHLLDDNSSSALIILGFVIMSPLIVVAMAIYCGLSRRLRLFLLFQPFKRAKYQGLQWKGIHGAGHGWCCSEDSFKAWV
ncbi:transmembrane protein 88 [Polypterus senegalus]